MTDSELPLETIERHVVVVLLLRSVNKPMNWKIGDLSVDRKVMDVERREKMKL